MVGQTGFHRKSKLFLAMFLVFAVVTLQGVDALAVFSPDISITGNVEYDTGFADSYRASLTGGFSKTAGGAVTNSTFNVAAVTGGNPLAGTLTSIGDGFGFSANGAGNLTVNDESEFAAGFDMMLNITNNSLTFPYWITFNLNFSNSVTSSGADTYTSSEFTLDDPTGEIFFTDLLSDAANGNEVGGVSVGGYGGNLNDSGTPSFTKLLGPGETWFYDGAFTMEGGAYENPSSCSGGFSANFTVTDVTQVVPEPATAILISIGAACANRMRRRRGPRSRTE
ncbi:MAG: PEP-CTERM sorting domain-containing protein [Phycisphaerae bacterium]|nr:PEP-CTERM sorting domain-containing protein [Phycisphaerae bacterium]